MRQGLATLSLLALFLGGCQPGVPTRYERSGKRPRLHRVSVLIDPGHGGTDSGAKRGGRREDALTYRMASTLAAALRAEGATVSFTVTSRALLRHVRDGESEPPLIVPRDARFAFNGAPVRLRRGENPEDLYRRAAAARLLWLAQPEARRATGRGGYFLSIHFDQLENPAWRGARVYVDKRLKGDPPSFARRLKKRLRETGFSRSSRDAPLSRDLGVLNPHYNPIPQRALLEAATLSNREDREAAATPQWRWRLARLIVDVVADCERGRS